MTHHNQNQQAAINLIGLKCPMAFVKCRMFLDSLTPKSMCIIIYEANSSNEPLERSIVSLGHTITATKNSSEDMPNSINLDATIITLTVKIK